MKSRRSQSIPTSPDKDKKKEPPNKRTSHSATKNVVDNKKKLVVGRKTSSKAPKKSYSDQHEIGRRRSSVVTYSANSRFFFDLYAKFGVESSKQHAESSEKMDLQPQSSPHLKSAPIFDQPIPVSPVSHLQQSKEKVLKSSTASNTLKIHSPKNDTVRVISRRSKKLLDNDLEVPAKKLRVDDESCVNQKSVSSKDSTDMTSPATRRRGRPHKASPGTTSASRAQSLPSTNRSSKTVTIPVTRQQIKPISGLHITRNIVNKSTRQHNASISQAQKTENDVNKDSKHISPKKISQQKSKESVSLAQTKRQSLPLIAATRSSLTRSNLKSNSSDRNDNLSPVVKSSSSNVYSVAISTKKQAILSTPSNKKLESPNSIQSKRKSLSFENNEQPVKKVKASTISSSKLKQKSNKSNRIPASFIGSIKSKREASLNAAARMSILYTDNEPKRTPVSKVTVVKDNTPKSVASSSPIESSTPIKRSKIPTKKLLESEAQEEYVSKLSPKSSTVTHAQSKVVKKIPVTDKKDINSKDFHHQKTMKNESASECSVKNLSKMHTSLQKNLKQTTSKTNDVVQDKRHKPNMKNSDKLSICNITAKGIIKKKILSSHAKKKLATKRLERELGASSSTVSHGKRQASLNAAAIINLVASDILNSSISSVKHTSPLTVKIDDSKSIASNVSTPSTTPGIMQDAPIIPPVVPTNRRMLPIKKQLSKNSYGDYSSKCDSVRSIPSSSTTDNAEKLDVNTKLALNTRHVSPSDSSISSHSSTLPYKLSSNTALPSMEDTYNKIIGRRNDSGRVAQNSSVYTFPDSPHSSPSQSSESVLPSSSFSSTSKPPSQRNEPQLQKTKASLQHSRQMLLNNSRRFPLTSPRQNPAFIGQKHVSPKKSPKKAKAVTPTTTMSSFESVVRSSMKATSVASSSSNSTLQPTIAIHSKVSTSVSSHSVTKVATVAAMPMHHTNAPNSTISNSMTTVLKSATPVSIATVTKTISSNTAPTTMTIVSTSVPVACTSSSNNTIPYTSSNQTHVSSVASRHMSTNVTSAPLNNFPRQTVSTFEYQKPGGLASSSTSYAPILSYPVPPIVIQSQQNQLSCDPRLQTRPSSGMQQLYSPRQMYPLGSTQPAPYAYAANQATRGMSPFYATYTTPSMFSNRPTAITQCVPTVVSQCLPSSNIQTYPSSMVQKSYDKSHTGAEQTLPGNLVTTSTDIRPGNRYTCNYPTISPRAILPSSDRQLQTTSAELTTKTGVTKPGVVSVLSQSSKIKTTVTPSTSHVAIAPSDTKVHILAKAVSRKEVPTPISIAASPVKVQLQPKLIAPLQVKVSPSGGQPIASVVPLSPNKKAPILPRQISPSKIHSTFATPVSASVYKPLQAVSPVKPIIAKLISTDTHPTSQLVGSPNTPILSVKKSSPVKVSLSSAPIQVACQSNSPVSIAPKMSPVKVISPSTVTVKTQSPSALSPVTVNIVKSPRSPRGSISSSTKTVDRRFRAKDSWSWVGPPAEKYVFTESDSAPVKQTCYMAVRHQKDGMELAVRDSVLLRSGFQGDETPFVAKITALYQQPDSDEKMMALLWFYRPEHTEQGRKSCHVSADLYASRHRDKNPLACIEDKAYVLTEKKYARFMAEWTRRVEGRDKTANLALSDGTDMFSPEMTVHNVFLCRGIYDFKQRRIHKRLSYLPEYLSRTSSQMDLHDEEEEDSNFPHDSSDTNKGEKSSDDSLHIDVSMAQENLQGTCDYDEDTMSPDGPLVIADAVPSDVKSLPSSSSVVYGLVPSGPNMVSSASYSSPNKSISTRQAHAPFKRFPCLSSSLAESGNANKPTDVVASISGSNGACVVSVNNSSLPQSVTGPVSTTSVNNTDTSAAREVAFSNADSKPNQPILNITDSQSSSNIVSVDAPATSQATIPVTISTAIESQTISDKCCRPVEDSGDYQSHKPTDISSTSHEKEDIVGTATTILTTAIKSEPVKSVSDTPLKPKTPEASVVSVHIESEPVSAHVSSSDVVQHETKASSIPSISSESSIIEPRESAMCSNISQNESLDTTKAGSISSIDNTSTQNKTSMVSNNIAIKQLTIENSTQDFSPDTNDSSSIPIVTSDANITQEQSKNKVSIGFSENTMSDKSKECVSNTTITTDKESIDKLSTNSAYNLISESSNISNVCVVTADEISNCNPSSNSVNPVSEMPKESNVSVIATDKLTENISLAGNSIIELATVNDSTDKSSLVLNVTSVSESILPSSHIAIKSMKICPQKESKDTIPQDYTTSADNFESVRLNNVSIVLLDEQDLQKIVCTNQVNIPGNSSPRSDTVFNTITSKPIEKVVLDSESQPTKTLPEQTGDIDTSTCDAQPKEEEKDFESNTKINSFDKISTPTNVQDSTENVEIVSANSVTLTNCSNSLKGDDERNSQTEVDPTDVIVDISTSTPCSLLTSSQDSKETSTGLSETCKLFDVSPNVTESKDTSDNPSDTSKSIDVSSNVTDSKAASNNPSDTSKSIDVSDSKDASDNPSDTSKFIDISSNVTDTENASSASPETSKPSDVLPSDNQMSSSFYSFKSLNMVPSPFDSDESDDTVDITPIIDSLPPYCPSKPDSSSSLPQICEDNEKQNTPTNPATSTTQALIESGAIESCPPTSCSVAEPAMERNVILPIPATKSSSSPRFLSTFQPDDLMPIGSERNLSEQSTHGTNLINGGSDTIS